jgi:hypothetical protein
MTAVRTGGVKKKKNVMLREILKLYMHGSVSIKQQASQRDGFVLSSLWDCAHRHFLKITLHKIFDEVNLHLK